MNAKALMRMSGLVLAAGMFNGCTVPDPNQLPNPTYNYWKFFPYIIHNATYTSYICATNTSPWAMDLTVTYRNAGGAVVVTDQRRLSGHEAYRFVPGAMEGSVEITGVGDIYALKTHLEIRDPSGKAAALVPPATTLGPYGIPWYFQLGVIDESSGTIRSKIISTALYSTPMYLEFAPLPGDCPDFFEVKLNPYQTHTFLPGNQFVETGSSGLADWTIYVAGNTGPNRSGQQCGIHTGTVFTTTPEDISVDSFADVNTSFWDSVSSFPNQARQLYLADVQDDGVNRADRIYVKSNDTTNWDDYTQQLQLQVHFYATDGTETTRWINLYIRFDDVASCDTISPKELLGANFKGSVWIECQTQIQATLRRVAPGKWSDLTGASPAGSLLTGCVPYVSTKDASWRYQLALFYPENIYPRVHPGPDIPPIRFVDPSQPEPIPEPGEVVLTLWNAQGGLEGWVVVFLGINETAYVDINDVAANYLKKPFDGSIQFDPLVVLEAELAHESGLAHGSVNTWQSGQQ